MKPETYNVSKQRCFFWLLVGGEGGQNSRVWNSSLNFLKHLEFNTLTSETHCEGTMWLFKLKCVVSANLKCSSIFQNGSSKVESVTTLKSSPLRIKRLTSKASTRNKWCFIYSTSIILAWQVQKCTLLIIIKKWWNFSEC